MAMYRVHVDLGFSSETEDGAAVHGTRVMEALADLDESNPDLLDWALGVNTEQGFFEFDLTVTAAAREDAVALSHGLIRTAIHEAGGSTLR
jgi:hypothetical protein